MLENSVGLEPSGWWYSQWLWSLDKGEIPENYHSSGRTSRKRLALEGAFRTRLDSYLLHVMQLGTLNLDRQIRKRVYWWPQPRRSVFSGGWKPFRGGWRS